MRKVIKMDELDLQMVQLLFLDRISEMKENNSTPPFVKYYEDLMKKTLEILQKEVDKQ